MVTGNDAGEAQPRQAQNAFEVFARARHFLRLLTDQDPDFDVSVMDSRDELEACGAATQAIASVAEGPHAEPLVELLQVIRDLLLVAAREERDLDENPAERWPEGVDARTAFAASRDRDRQQRQQKAAAIARLSDVLPRAERVVMSLEIAPRRRASSQEAYPPVQENDPRDDVEVLLDDRALLHWQGRKAEVRGPLSVWLLRRAWENRGKVVAWPALQRAQYEWNGRLESLKESAKGRAVDGSTRDAAQGARVVGADHGSLKRACRELRKNVNDQLGCEALTTEGGLMLADPEQTEVGHRSGDDAET